MRFGRTCWRSILCEAFHAVAVVGETDFPDCTFEHCPTCMPGAQVQRQSVAVFGPDAVQYEVPFRVGRCLFAWDSEAVSAQIVGLVISEFLGIAVEYVNCKDETQCLLALNGCAGWQHYQCVQPSTEAGLAEAVASGMKLYADPLPDVFFQVEMYASQLMPQFYKASGIEYESRTVSTYGTTGFVAQDALFIYADIVDLAWSRRSLDMESWKAYGKPEALEFLSQPQTLLDDGVVGIGGCSSEDSVVNASMEAHLSNGWSCHRSFWLNHACAARGGNWTLECIVIIEDDWGFMKPWLYGPLGATNAPIAKVMVGYDAWWELINYRVYDALFTWWGPDATFMSQRPRRIFTAEPHPDPALKAGHHPAIFGDQRLQYVLSNIYLDGQSMMKLMQNNGIAVDAGYAPDQTNETVSGAFYQKLACDFVRAHQDLVGQWLPSVRSCLLGQFFDEGSQSCLFCPIGTFSVRDCKVCAPGTFTDLPGALKCKPCSPGRYQNASGSRECGACPVGYAQTAPGQTECRICAEGTVAGAEGSLECMKCMAGTAAGAAAAACDLCTVGRFSEAQGAPACKDCLAGLVTSSRGSTGFDDCVCPARQLWPLNGNATSAAFTCLPCPSFMACLEGSRLDAFRAGGDDSNMRLLPGYMALASDSSKVYKCVAQQACPGGRPGTCAPFHDANSVACGLCTQGAYISGSGCLQCKGSNAHLIAVYVCLGFITVVIMAISVNRDIYQQSHSKMTVLALTALSLSTFQTLGTFRQFQISWLDPLHGVLEWLSFFTFDLDVVRLGCSFKLGPSALFISRQCVPLFGVIVVILSLLVKKVRHRSMDFGVELTNAVGTLFNVFFVSIMVSCSLPLVCYKHPEGNVSSVVASPSVLCFEGGQHFAMLLGGAASCLLMPVPFLDVVIFATYRYPMYISSVSQVGRRRMRQFRFLFFRYRAERYYWGLTLSMRGLAIAVVPVATTRGSLQVFSLAFVVTVFLCLQLHLNPWNTPSTNVGDGFLNAVVLFLLFLGAMANDFASELATIRTLAFVILIVAAVAWVLALLVSILKIHRRPPYYFFICHHKTDAQAQARLLKIQLTSQARKHVFIDSDNLENLDTLFDMVKTKTRVLVVYLTRSTLTRPWCAGEITVAFRTKRKILRVVCPSFLPPTNWDLLYLKDYIDFSGCNFQGYGISIDDISEAYNALPGTATVYLNSAKLGSSRIEGVAHDICLTSGVFHKMSISMSRVMSKVANLPSMIGMTTTLDEIKDLNQGRLKEDMLLVSCLPGSDEASAAAAIFIIKVRPKLLTIVQNGFFVLETSEDLDPQTVSFLPQARGIIVMLSSGTLTSRSQLRVILNLMSEDCKAAAISVGLPGFEFPKKEYYDQAGELASTGVDDMAIAVPALKDFFKIITITFATGASDQVLNIQSEAIMRRVPGTALKICRQKTSNRSTDIFAAADASSSKEDDSDDDPARRWPHCTASERRKKDAADHELLFGGIIRVSVADAVGEPRSWEDDRVLHAEAGLDVQCADEEGLQSQHTGSDFHRSPRPALFLDSHVASVEPETPAVKTCTGRPQQQSSGVRDPREGIDSL